MGPEEQFCPNQTFHALLDGHARQIKMQVNAVEDGAGLSLRLAHGRQNCYRCFPEIREVLTKALDGTGY